jgi:hypothetical protein
MMNSLPNLDRRGMKMLLRLQLYNSLLIFISILVIEWFRQRNLVFAILCAISIVALQWLIIGLHLLKTR